MKLSLVVPCYNEEESVALFYEELIKNQPFFTKEGIELELLYVDDGSRDKTVAEVKKLREKDERVHLVSFSRNFGKEAAMFAGLEAANGDYVVLMDVDLQDPPSLLPEMFSYIKEGYDSVATRRVSRKGEPPIRSFFARRFYGLMKKILLWLLAASLMILPIGVVAEESAVQLPLGVQFGMTLEEAAEAVEKTMMEHM